MQIKSLGGEVIINTVKRPETLLIEMELAIILVIIALLRWISKRRVWGKQLRAACAPSEGDFLFLVKKSHRVRAIKVDSHFRMTLAIRAFTARY